MFLCASSVSRQGLKVLFCNVSVSCERRCAGYDSSSTIARVSIFGFLESRTTRARACATSRDPFDVTRTRSFWDSLALISVIDEEEDGFGRPWLKRDRNGRVPSAIVWLSRCFERGKLRQTRRGGGMICRFDFDLRQCNCFTLTNIKLSKRAFYGLYLY